jgi:hypothetical protein
MVAPCRFHGQIWGVPHPHRKPENWVYNARRQPVLKGQAPNDIVQNRLTDKPELASKLDQPPAEFCARPKAMVVVERAKEVSHPDS